MSIVDALREIRDAIHIQSTALDTDYVYIELWKAKPSWWALPIEERGKKMGEIDVGSIPGATMLTAIINKAKIRRAPYDYFSVWKVETTDQLHKVEQRVENLDWWYDHWDEIHAWGKIQPAEEVGPTMVTGIPDAPEPPPKPLDFALVEMFKPKDSWYELSAAERMKIFEDLTAGVGDALRSGGSSPEIFLNRGDVEHHGDWTAVVLFRFPDEEAITAFLPGINQLEGWFENLHFQRVSGQLLPNPGPAIEAMIKAKKDS